MKHYFLRGIVLSSLYIILIICVFATFISENPFSPSYEVKKNIGKTLPQGWGFFTRNPREMVTTAYSIKNNNQLELKLNPNNADNSYWGLSRKNRREHLEFMRIQHLIPVSVWQEYKYQNLQIPSDTCYTSISNINHYNYFFIKEGLYLFLRYQKTPWIYCKGNIIFDEKKEFAMIKFIENP